MSKAPAWTEDAKYLRLDTRWTYKHESTEITWWPLATRGTPYGHGNAESVDWICAHCAQSCWWWRSECYSCRKPRTTTTATRAHINALVEATNQNHESCMSQDGKRTEQRNT